MKISTTRKSGIHAFENIDDYLAEYTNRSTFTVDEQTNEINVYFKVSFEASRNLPLRFWATKVTRSCHLTDADGMVQWEQDVSEDASPLEESSSPIPRLLKANGSWIFRPAVEGKHLWVHSRQFCHHRNHHQQLHSVPAG